jgi:hypothetical protein
MKREKVTEYWRKFIMRRFIIYTLHQAYSNDKIMKDVMGGAEVRLA